jgi:hypothetical protein
MDYLKVAKKYNTSTSHANQNQNQNQKENKKPGWVYITKDEHEPKKNNQIRYEYIPISIPVQLKRQPTITITLQPLINHWKKRKEEYKEIYGEEIYENMFLCKNYDYEYFDKLDNEQEERMEQQKYHENSDYDNH